MKKFMVSVPELWFTSVEVNAESAEEALEIVKDGGGEYFSEAEYSHTLEMDLTNVEYICDMENESNNKGE
jgi:hypothetical protein